jgi:hypothetical protein
MRHSGAIAIGIWLCTVALGAQQGTRDGQWRSYSGDAGSTKYAPLEQINKDNVRNLRILWRRPAVDPTLTAKSPALRIAPNFRATPLMINGVLYAPNGVGLAEAFDASTGKTRWVQEPFEANELEGDSTRGVAYWTDGRDERILIQRGEYLYALNAKTGKVYAGFGERGRVNLTNGLGPLMTRYYWTGAPLVIRDVVVIGASMTDSPEAKDQPRGDVRAFDVRTGALRWQFHVIPQGGEYGVDTWENESWKYTGQAPVWALFSADEELGYVYMPVTSPTSDMYGGHRLGNNLFGQSLVCVEGRYRRTRLALSTDAPRLVGLRSARGADPRQHQDRWAPRQGRRPGDEAGICLRLRPRDRQTRMADRGAAGAAVNDAGRANVEDAAVPNQAGAVRTSGLDHRQFDRLHARASSTGAGDRQAVRDGTALHAAVDSRHGRERHQRHDPVTGVGRWRGLARCGVRS